MLKMLNNIFISKRKEKKDKSTNSSAPSTYRQLTHVQSSSSNGGLSTNIYTRRELSSNSSQSSSTTERTFHHSASSAGNVPQTSTTAAVPSLQIDTSRWALGTGSLRSPSSSSSSGSRLPLIGRGSNFETSSTAQPRFSLPTSSSTRTPIPARTAFNSSTVARYNSTSSPSPALATSRTNSVQNASGAQSVVPACIENVIPIYSNNCSKKAGKALVINNIKFELIEERLGAKKDSSDLKSLFKKMGFDVELEEDMNGKNMLKKIEGFSKSSFFNHNILMVVIMSHGNNIGKDGKSRVKGGFTEIAGIDLDMVLVDNIIEKFTSSNCHPSLKGKPKIFIFQCCRGDKDQQVCHDGTPKKKVLKDPSDILITFSTLPGYLSNRDKDSGTWYIQSICEVFGKHYKDHHIEDMLKIVDEKLSYIHPDYQQTSTYENRGFKRCYLHPKGPTN